MIVDIHAIKLNMIELHFIPLIIKRHLVNDYYIKFFFKRKGLTSLFLIFRLHAIVLVSIFFLNQAPNDPDLVNKLFYCVY